MTWTEHESSLISATQYDAEAQRLRIKFKSGTTHSYDGVSPEEYEAMVSAPSVGRHFLTNIKGAYPSQRG